MTRDVPGFPQPGPGTEAPLEMLAACHGRVERQCATLRRLVPHVAAKGADDEARAAAERVMRYFDTSGPQHHADEEEDLFPALLEAMAGSDAICIREMTDALRAEHRRLEELWDRVRAPLARIAAGQAVPLPGDSVEAMAALYETHIAREENELLPMAQRLLTDEELAAIGRAMRARRGIADV